LCACFDSIIHIACFLTDLYISELILWQGCLYCFFILISVLVGTGREGIWRRKWERLKAGKSNGKLPLKLAQIAACKSHAGRLTGLLFLPKLAQGLNTSQSINRLGPNFIEHLSVNTFFLFKP
jgi:hypothetical protein